MNEYPFFHCALLHETNANLILDEDTRRHVVTVLRMQAGDHLMLMNGNGLAGKARIEVADKKHLEVKIIEVESFPKPAFKIALGISLLKNASRFEWMLEKVTEIGLTDIFPIISERTEKTHFRIDRMRQIIISASIQSKQMWMPVLHSPKTYKELLALSDHDCKMIAHCLSGEKTILKKQAKDCLLLIGPEGDFTPIEIENALAHDFIPVTLGDSRLRTETAGVVGAVLMKV